MNNKKGGLGLLLICIIGFVVLKNLIPMLAGLFGILLAVCGLAFAGLLVAIIVSGLKSGEEEAKKKAETDGHVLTADEKKAIDETKSVITRVRVAAARINDVEIRNGFTEVCEKIEKIVSNVKKNPSNFQAGRRVVNYYAQSVEEIQTKYVKLQESGTDIDGTPEKVKESLSEIKAALDKLYSGLYEGDKLDLSVEMKSLSIAMKRDGLVDDNFAKIAEDFTIGKKDDAEESAE